MEFSFAKCDHKFKVDWETIRDIQECTHGYVGFHLNDTLISCDKCGEICNDNNKPIKGIEDYESKPTKSIKYIRGSRIHEQNFYSLTIEVQEERVLNSYKIQELVALENNIGLLIKIMMQEFTIDYAFSDQEAEPEYSQKTFLIILNLIIH